MRGKAFYAVLLMVLIHLNHLPGVVAASNIAVGKSTAGTSIRSDADENSHTKMVDNNKSTMFADKSNQEFAAARITLGAMPVSYNKVVVTLGTGAWKTLELRASNVDISLTTSPSVIEQIRNNSVLLEAFHMTGYPGYKSSTTWNPGEVQAAFDTVSFRFLYLLIPEKNAMVVNESSIRIAEVEVYHIAPARIWAEDLPLLVVPQTGVTTSEAMRSSVLGDDGEEMEERFQGVVYSFPEEYEGISIDPVSGVITVYPHAEKGVYQVVVTSTVAPAIYTVKPLMVGIEHAEADVLTVYEGLSLQRVVALGENLSLPAASIEGVEIAWSSEKPAIIDETGRVTPARLHTPVKMAAVIMKEAYSRNKAFEVVVIGDMEGVARLEQEAVLTTSQPANSSNENLTGENWDKRWSSATAEGTAWLQFDFKNPSMFNTLVLGDVQNVSSVVFAYSVNGTTWITHLEQLVRDGFALYTFPYVEARYLRLTLTQTGRAEIAGLGICFSPTDRECVTLAAKALDIGALTGITSDIQLPLCGAYGTTVAWHSDQPNVISPAGTVWRQSANTGVTLTATLQKGGEQTQKTFFAAVKGNQSTGGGDRPGRVVASGSTSAGLVYAPGEDIVSQPLPAEGKKAPFRDLGGVPWAEEYIVRLAERGIVNGTAEGIFSPEALVTREEFLKMVMEGLQIRSQADADFSDVPQAHWAYSYVAGAKEHAIVSGIGEGRFGLGNSITRQDMAVMAAKAAAIAGLVHEGEHKMLFVDEEEISDYAKEAVHRLAGQGILSGNTTRHFEPQGYATRAQAAKVVCLIMKGVGQ